MHHDRHTGMRAIGALQHSKQSIWVPPMSDFIKINVDVAFSHSAAPFGIGYIMRNSSGKFLFASTETGNSTSPNEAECWG
ncbi:hypothetical protein FRX31_019402, partial [Thalictrum thalictroides]